MLTQILCAIGGLIVGGVAIWLLLRGRILLAQERGRSESAVDQASLREQLDGTKRELADVTQRLNTVQTTADEKSREVAVRSADLARLESEVAARQQRVEELQLAQKKLADDLTGKSDALSKRDADLAQLRTLLDEERKQNAEKLDLLRAAREDLTNQFKQLAGDILEDKSKRFTEQNKLNLDQLLTPLKEKITTFQSKVEEVYVKETKDRSALTKQVEMLMNLNTQLSEDAQNLTLALKGDRKAQGNWGEIILEDVLERGGLVRDLHFKVQESRRENGAAPRQIPDVVVHLPEDRSIVIDSKLTLPDYRAFAAADDDTERGTALKRHLNAVRTHIKRLSEKNYQSQHGLQSLDFVVMFVPLEPAFMLAVTNDRELFNFAWERNILIVSPSTLLFVIRTIANLWRQEDLRQNSQEIAKRGAILYDKFAGFAEDLEKIGDRLQQASATYEDARKKLHTGNGNLVRQAEMLKKLGVQPSKSMPLRYVDDEDDQNAQNETESNSIANHSETFKLPS